MSIQFSERHPCKGIIRSVYVSPEGLRKVDLQSDPKSPRWHSLDQIFRETFLPRGYPASVCPDYLAYQIWDSFQAFGSSITGTLATHNVLKGIGVGDQSASVMSATLTWLLKDGTGMVGRIIFTYSKGSHLDVDCKKWRLFADIINDFAIGLDMICPLFPRYLLFLQCFSGLIKSLVGTIGGATRAALTQHQARDNNLADVSAKDGSQETLVNLAALVTSLLIMPLIETDSLIWFLFVLLTTAHIYCNYRAVRSVNMEVFNPVRWSSFVENYFFDSILSSVKEINRLENVWFFKSHLYQGLIKSGVPLSGHSMSTQQIDNLTNNFTHMDYILTYNNNSHPNCRGKSVTISFIEGKDSVRNKLKAYCHAVVILRCLNGKPDSLSKLKQLLHKETSESESSRGNVDPFTPESIDCDSIVRMTSILMNKCFDKMVTQAIGKGWNLDNFILLENGWRITKEEFNNKKSN